MVMVVGFLMIGDLLIALTLGILPAGRTERRAPRAVRAHGKHRQQSFHVVTLARGT
jgi:hypothetical protein